MKRNTLKAGLLLFGLMLSAAAGYAQMLQTSIASKTGRSELITEMKTLSDGTAIIGGYIYDVGGNTAVNADMILLRVKPDGTILWQQQFGTDGSSANDIMQGLTITQNEDILVVGTVGRSNVYVNNTGAIFRFDKNGNMLWKNFVRRDRSVNAPGEILMDVAELANGNIMAVGTADFAPGAAKSMICYFDGSGNLLYNETYDRTGSSSDEFIGVCADGNSAVVVGKYDGRSYKDTRILHYTPGTTSGAINWDLTYDIDGVTNGVGTPLSSVNIASKVYIRNNRVVIAGDLGHTWNPSENAQVFFECDLSNGGNAAVRSLDNQTLTYANNTAFYPVDENRFFAVQNPSTSFADAVFWTNTMFANAVISEVQPFQTSGQVLQSKEFDLPGNQSIFDITMNGGNVYMGGCTSSTGSAVDNDIYFVVSKPNLVNTNKSCQLNETQVTISEPRLTSSPGPDNISTFTNDNDYTIAFTSPGLASTTICGEDVTTPTGGDCSQQCYWRLDGNSAVTAGDKFGTLNDEDVRMVTNGQQRAVLERKYGNFGLNTAAPTARLHVLCQPPKESPSDIRFEQLGYGSGAVLVIDDDGYVYKSKKAEAKTTPAVDSLTEIIAQLQRDVAYLMSAARQTDAGSGQTVTVNLYPNPANNYVELVVTGGLATSDCQVQITDVSGKVLISQPSSLSEGRKIVINTSSLLPGNYFVKLMCGGKTTAVKSLAIQK